MANVKITDLAAYTNPAATDVLPIVDVGADAGAGITKKVSIENLLKNASSGTAAAPGIAFDGDPNTGIYRPDEDQLALSVNGSEGVTLTTTGLGIGNSTPRGIIHIGADLASGATDAAAINLKQTSTTASTGIYLERSGERKGYSIYVGGDQDSLTFQRNNAGTKSDVMVLTRSGAVGIGTESPARQLTVYDSSDPVIQLVNSTTDTTANDGVLLYESGSDFVIENQEAGEIKFLNNGSQRVTIDSSGRLLVGATSDSGGALLQVNGDRVRIATAKTPASATDTGTAGEVCWDANYVYVCTATNTWKRSALSTW